MAKKKGISTKAITAEDILSLYETVLPLLNNNPENIDVAYTLSKKLTGFIPYDSFHYVLNHDEDAAKPEHFRMQLERWTDPKSKKGTVSNLEFVPLHYDDPDAIFDASVEHHYQMTLERKRKDQPGKLQYHYHRLTSHEEPKVAVGFFRLKNTKADNAFSAKDLHVFEKLSPHILLLFRTILNPAYRTKPFQYFEAYSQICATIANQCRLSDSEAKLLPEILFGYSNEEIAEKNFISVPTVKKHIQHIFKKTGVKNRLDFISRFFTSPGRVELT